MMKVLAFFFVATAFVLSCLSCSAHGVSAAQKTTASTAPVAGRQWVVDQGNPRADDTGAGTVEQPFKTIAPAAAQAQPGDTVLVKAGVYRECIIPAHGGKKDHPITYLAESGHKVIVRGSEVWKTNWRDDGQGVFFATFDSPIFSQGNPFTKELFGPETAHGKARPGFPEHHALGQLFVNGAELAEVKQRDQLNQTAGTWLVEKDGLFVHFPAGVVPEKAQIETSIRTSIFSPHRRGLNYIHVSGFVLENCAGSALNTRTGSGWVIENNVVRHARNTGIVSGSETWLAKTLPDTDPADQRLMFGGHNLIRGNTVSDCGVDGITGWNDHHTRVIDNIIERNNTLGVYRQEVQAGIKFASCSDLLFEGNLVRDNNAYGIWLDNGWDRCRITRNTIVGNACGGVFIELGNGGATVDHNLIGLSHPFAGQPGGGYGIYTHDTSGVVLANNLIWGNAAEGIMMRTLTNRIVHHKGTPNALVQTSHMKVLNNIIVGESAISLPFPNARSHDNQSDWNFFTADRPRFTINWTQIPKVDRQRDQQQSQLSTDMIDLAQWQKLFSTETHSMAEPGWTVKYDADTLNLTITVPQQGVGLRCPPLSGLDRDFYNQAYPAGDVMPGPFIDLHAGNQVIQTWPIINPGAR